MFKGEFYLRLKIRRREFVINNKKKKKWKLVI